MKKIFGLLFCIYLTSCLFGANGSSKKIMKEFYLASWDEKDWIVYSKDGKDIFEDRNIVIGHDIFAIGDNDDFIIGKQYPCENKHKHYMDFDSLKPNRSIINYFIIDTRNDSYKLKNFDNEIDFYNERAKLGIPENLNYKFIDMRIE